MSVYRELSKLDSLLNSKETVEAKIAEYNEAAKNIIRVLMTS